jgi:hypothetical protein
MIVQFVKALKPEALSKTRIYKLSSYLKENKASPLQTPTGK